MKKKKGINYVEEEEDPALIAYQEYLAKLKRKR